MRNLIFGLMIFLIASCGSNQNSQNSSTDSTAATQAIDTQVVAAAREAFIFGMPLVLMDLTRRKMTDGNNKEASAINSFANKSSFPDANFRDVVRPNADTYYSTASLDLFDGPIVLSVPNTHGRYYMMPMLDAYTNVFASPGSRTTGTDAANFLITGPGWSGQIPAGMKQIKAPTNMIWILGRTQVNSKEDGEKVVVPIQKKYKLTPLSAWGNPYTSPTAVADPSLSKEGPNQILNAMPIDEFFNDCNRLMIKNPPAVADQPVMEKLAAIGFKPGGTFDLKKYNAATQQALKKIPLDFSSTVNDFFSKPKGLVNGWNPMRGVQGSYGTDYMTRAFIAYGGLGANLKEDAMYPSTSLDADGHPLNGANKYVIHFDKGKTPPAKAFWSITMYDPDGYMVANPINRNAIGDRSSLQKNTDGSTDIYIQHDSPGKDKEKNWLPAPTGDFNILMRVYWPKEEMINGSWKAPAVRKI